MTRADDGELSVFSSESTRLRHDADAFATAITTAASMSNAVSGDWTGTAADAVVFELSTIAPEFELLRAWLDGDATAHDAYLGELSAIKETATSLRAASEDLGQQLTSARWRADDAENDLERARMSGDPHEMQQQRLRLTGARQHVGAIEQSIALNARSLDALADRRTLADAAFVAALEAAVPTGLLPRDGFGGSSSDLLGVTASAGLLTSSHPAGMELLHLLSGMTPAARAVWLEDNPNALSTLVSSPPRAADVAAWWLSLNPGARPGALNARQRDLLELAPDVFGNLDGVSYAGRDVANRIRLRQIIDDPSTSVTAQANRAAAEALLAALAAGPDDPVHQLISFRPGSPPLGAISVGDLDNAMYVNYMISGMGTTTAGDAVGWTNQAEWMHFEQTRIADRTGIAGGSAVIAWLGYEAPPIPVTQGTDFGVVMGDYARSGGDNLARDLQGLLTVRSATSNDPFLSVTGHSYGTTTAANALTQVGVDAFTMLGSAGIERSISRDDLLVPPGEVYSAMANEQIPWASIGQGGSGRQDPSTIDGVQIWYPNAETIDGTLYEGTNVHETHLPETSKSGYLEKGTTSLYNTALTALGRGDQIANLFDEPTPRPSPGPAPTPPSP
ncbi:MULTISPECIES: alpha/beta hydrolase [unclassified Salinibacterium]|uniref:alpha/beta hydrolase n=1 Tax=unclassified Salinibacterium TaxID=2632331 RepID=UPI00141DC25D|nr:MULTISPECIES: alpha/beta hydrolase [unclassified Salinibacterium]